MTSGRFLRNYVLPPHLPYNTKADNTRLDVSIRLRRAITLNDALLVKRIVGQHPTQIRNPDVDDRSNTSLHLAAKLGHVEIARLLIDAGHEQGDISLNTDYETPLMLACEHRQIDMGTLLIEGFPRCIPWANKYGMDSLMLSSRHGALPLLPPLLAHPTHPASPLAHDADGNTALHHASAAGELKALRLLLQSGASPLAQNSYSWTPIACLATAAAEAYFKQLVADVERRRVEARKEAREREMQRVAGVRVVGGAPEEWRAGRPRGGSEERRTGSALGVRVAWEEPQFAAPQPPLDWSPAERVATTPVEGKSGWGFARRRAGSGE